MKPNMPHIVMIEIEDRSQKPNDHGQYPTIKTDSIGRVRRTERVITTVDGRIRQSQVEVDLPPEVRITEGAKIRFVDPFGKLIESTVTAVEESTNLAGNRVDFRTAIGD